MRHNTVGQDHPRQLTQHDIRELQKARVRLSAAIDTLMAQLNLAPGDLTRSSPGSFGSQLSIDAVAGLGVLRDSAVCSRTTCRVSQPRSSRCRPMVRV
jgi:uncharacterized 2Fe-2S/4Fe-4S cluster protein (DUF4445 family)